MRHLLFSLLAIFFISCALPNEDLRQSSNFIPKEEQLAIKLVREGSDFFLKGRYYHAEMRYRQADYLFPNRKNIRINLINTLIRSMQFEVAKESLDQMERLFSNDLDLSILKAKYYQAMGNYQEAILSYQQSRILAKKLELTDYQATIADNLSAIYFLIGDEDLGLANAGLSFNLLNTPEVKANYARLQVGLGFDRFSEDLKIPPNRLIKADQDFLTWQLLMTQIANSEQSSKLINQMRLFQGEKAKLSLDLQFLEIVNKQDFLEAEKEQTEATLSETVLPILWREGNLKPEVRLYWPVNLIRQLQKTCLQFKGEADLSACQIS